MSVCDWERRKRDMTDRDARETQKRESGVREEGERGKQSSRVYINLFDI